MKSPLEFSNFLINDFHVHIGKYNPEFIAKQAAEGRKSRAATFEAEVACEAVFGSFATVGSGL